MVCKGHQPGERKRSLAELDRILHISTYDLLRYMTILNLMIPHLLAQKSGKSWVTYRVKEVGSVA